MKHVMHSELAQWLRAATHGLPAHEATITEMELKSHYEDACDDYQAQGKSVEEAHRQAMIDLGAPDTTSAGLRDVHVGTRRYSLAAALSLVIVAVLLGFPRLHMMIGFSPLSTSEILFYVLFTAMMYIPSITVVSILKNLLEWRFQVSGLRLPFLVLTGGLLIYVTLDDLTLFVYRYSVGYGNGQSPFITGTFIETIVASVVYLAQIATAAGVILFVRRLWPYRDRMYGLGTLITLLMTLLALSVAGTATALVFRFHTAEMLLMLLENLTHMLLWPIFTLIFYRAISRGAELPRRFA
jgi:hypothetical protein